MPLLTREQILAADDLKRETIPVPEWGGDVIVKSLTGAERDAFEDSVVKQRGKSRELNLRNARARLVSLSLIDEAGNRLFTDADVELLGKKSAAALDRVFSAAQRLSGLTENDIDELAKNSGSGQSDSSTSD
jgi:hypothetical protein